MKIPNLLFQPEDIFAYYRSRSFTERDGMPMRFSLIPLIRGNNIENGLPIYLDEDVIKDYLNWQLSDLVNLTSSELFKYSESMRTEFVNLHSAKNHPIFLKGYTFEKLIIEFKKMYEPDFIASVCPTVQPLFDFTALQNESEELNILIAPKSPSSSCINHWFPEMWNTKVNGKSVIGQIYEPDNFHKYMIKIIREYLMGEIQKGKLKYDSRISSKLIGLLRVINRRQPVYNFNVPISKFAYKEAFRIFSNDKEFKILDMSMGWGARMTAGMSLMGSPEFYDKKILYYGTDPNATVNNRFAMLYNFNNNFIYPLKDNFNFYKSMIPAEKIFEDPVFNKMENEFHVMLTSPPYFNKEVYSDDHTQSCNAYTTYSDWSIKFLYPMIQNTFKLLKPGGLMFINIADIKHTKTSEKGKFHPLESNTLKYAEMVGFQYIKEYKYVSNIMQGMRRDGGDAKKPISRHEVIINGQYHKYEPLFVFQKPF